MGSGNGNRKNSDTTSIRRPKAYSGFGISATAGEEYNPVTCIPSFDVLIRDSALVKIGMPIYLQKEGLGYFINISGLVKISLPAKFSKMIIACLAMGVKYTGQIIEIKNHKYARFTRML